MAKKYKIVVPKPAADDEKGMNIRLFKADEIVVSKGEWQDSIMDGFVANDDPDTPDVNEAWEGGKAPKKKAVKKTTKKKSTKKKA